jgi:hypothetical protein
MGGSTQLGPHEAQPSWGCMQPSTGSRNMASESTTDNAQQSTALLVVRRTAYATMIQDCVKLVGGKTPLVKSTSFAQAAALIMIWAH